MIKIKKSFPFIGLLITCIAMLFSTLTTSIWSYAISLENVSIENEADFIDGNYLCYYLDTSSNPNTVAIAWGGNMSTTGILDVPKTVVDAGQNNKKCRVSAVAYAGFRYTKFTAINLPDSVTEIGKESFAYCLNLQSFSLPYEVSVIPASAFLDCRALVNFSYRKEIPANYIHIHNGTTWVNVDPKYSFEESPNSHDFTDDPAALDDLYFDSTNIKLYQYNSSSVWVDLLVPSGNDNPLDSDIAGVNGEYYIETTHAYPEAIINTNVVEIEDHAFDSCVSLLQFHFPESLERIGQSSFQRCSSFTRLYLPTDEDLSIESYAFSDCSKLEWVYFEKNLVSVGHYAFTGCSSNLVFHYGLRAVDDSDFDETSESSINSKFNFDSNWRQCHLATSRASEKIPFEKDRFIHFRTEDHPEMVFSIEKGPIYLDCQRFPDGDETKICIDQSTDYYAVLRQWTPPKGSNDEYYNAGTGALIIPNTVTNNSTNYTVKTIGQEAFKNQTDLTSIKFSNGLVQICKNAFYRCVNVTNLDFDGVTTLKEISNSVFNSRESNTENKDYTSSIAIPASVNYIGAYAFFNFTRVNGVKFQTPADITNARHSQLLVLGGYSFGCVGKKLDAGVIDVVLPCTLDDSKAKEAKINSPIGVSGNDGGDYNNENWAAVGPYCFGAGLKDVVNNNPGTAVKTVTMEECQHTTSGHASASSFTTSLAPNAFARSSYLTRFVSNKNLCFIGADTFKNCVNVREVFLGATKAEASNKPYPWGTKDEGETFNQSLFSGASFPNLLIYVDSEEAPGDLDTVAWNAETGSSFPHEADTTFSRSSIPIIYNVNFDFSDSTVLYWSPGNNDDNDNSNDGGSFLANPPSTDDEYNGTASGCENGIIVFAKIKISQNNEKYTVVKYYYDDNKNVPLSTINLTNIVEHDSAGDITSEIISIGSEAFANTNAKHRGLYYILPDCVEEIGERAFYRKAATANDSLGECGVRIVTYLDDETIQPSNSAFSTTKATCDSNQTPAANRKGYCVLPAGLKVIGRNAFYSNIFETVTLGSDLEFLGKSAFYSHHSSTAVRSKLKSITVAGSPSYFDDTSNGLYYIGDNDYKTLLYQAQADTSTSLSIASGTKAIGMHALANTSYQTITLNADLTHIYGGGFQNNLNLNTVTVPTGSNLKYIGAFANEDELWNDSLPFDVVDYFNNSTELMMKRSQGAAFKGCTSLATFNLKNLRNLVKIGRYSFQNCSSLSSMVGNDTYTYCNNSEGNVIDNAISNGILDLSNATHLSAIGPSAFAGCNSIKYIHLPKKTNDNWLYVSGDPDDDGDSNGSIIPNNSITVLVGDKAIDACWSSPTVQRDNPTVAKHYNSGCFGAVVGNKCNTVYYYAEYKSDLIGYDLPNNTETGIKYWTISNGKYILMDYATAMASLPNSN